MSERSSEVFSQNQPPWNLGVGASGTLFLVTIWPFPRGLQNHQGPGHSVSSFFVSSLISKEQHWISHRSIDANVRCWFLATAERPDTAISGGVHDFLHHSHCTELADRTRQQNLQQLIVFCQPSTSETNETCKNWYGRDGSKHRKALLCQTEIVKAWLHSSLPNTCWEAEKVFWVGFLGPNISSQGIWKPGCNLLQLSSITLSHCRERWSQKSGGTRIFSCKAPGPSASFGGPPTQVCIHPRKINSLNLKMMLWCRWFSEIPGVKNSQVPAVNLQGCMYPHVSTTSQLVFFHLGIHRNPPATSNYRNLRFLSFPIR